MKTIDKREMQKNKRKTNKGRKEQWELKGKRRSQRKRARLWLKVPIDEKIEYDKLYPSGSVPAHIYGTPEMHKFSSSDSFPKLHLIVSSIYRCF